MMACCLMAPSRYLNQCWLKSSNAFHGIHLRAISQEVHEILFHKLSLKITLLKLQLHIPGVDGLMCWIQLIMFFNCNVELVLIFNFSLLSTEHTSQMMTCLWDISPFTAGHVGLFWYHCTDTLSYNSTHCNTFSKNLSTWDVMGPVVYHLWLCLR